MLFESSFARSYISPIFSIAIQPVLPCYHDPLGRYADEADVYSLYATRFLDPESLGVKLANDDLIEIVYQCSKQKKDSILRHE